jgi:hypothetical protein
MRRFIVCTAVCLLLPAQAWALSEDQIDTPPELAPAKTTFAYRARHTSTVLPDRTFQALWFSGEDRALPRDAVAEPIEVLPAHAVRRAPSRTALCDHAAIVAAEHDLPAPFFANLIQQESGFKSHVVSSAGAQGIAQFMPRVARAYGLENPFDPIHSLSVSARFLRELVGQFGNLGLAAAAYNAGPKRVQDWMARRGKLPEETRNYVRNITGHPAERWARINAKTEEAHLPAHARCPGMPVMAIAIPEAAPVKVAKNSKIKKDVKVAATPKELPKLVAAKTAGPKLAAAKFTLASSTPSRTVAVIKNGKIQIVTPEKAKPVAKIAAVKPAKAAKPVKLAASTKPAVKPKTAKDQAKPVVKRMKVAAAR